MNEILPGLYDHIEPVALRIARRAAEATPIDAQRAYLIGISEEIVASGLYRALAPSAVVPAGIEATLGWFDLLETHLDDFLSGAKSARDLIAVGGGGLWEAFQARDLVCAAFGHGVARALGPKVAGRDVLELGAGSGGTTKRMAADLKETNRFVVSDIRQSFLDKLVAVLPGVPVETALVDLNTQAGVDGTFDYIFATNCVHVAQDMAATLAWLHTCLKPGGALVLGEGSHYRTDVVSPVAVVLSLFDGWWNIPTSPARPQPGFMMPEHWFAAFQTAGFSAPGLELWTDGRRNFGGVYWAHA